MGLLLCRAGSSPAHRHPALDTQYPPSASAGVSVSGVCLMDALKPCRWFRHSWGKWELIEVIIDYPFNPSMKEALGDRQQRRCLVCGRYQRRTIN